MDKDTLNQMPEYVKNLPKDIQNFVFNDAWEERTGDIAKKYALNEEQTESLKDFTLLVLIGLEKPETFLDTLISELGISRLLAEQIMEEIDKRVFEFAIKTLDKKTKPQTPDYTSPISEPKKIESKLPEIAPDNLPAKEDNILIEKHDFLKSQENLVSEKPKVVETTKNTSEQVQRPVSVPRFTATPIEEDVNETPESPEVKEQNQDKKPETEKPKEPVKKYVVDPYREPLE